MTNEWTLDPRIIHAMRIFCDGPTSPAERGGEEMMAISARMDARSALKWASHWRNDRHAIAASIDLAAADAAAAIFAAGVSAAEAAAIFTSLAEACGREIPAPTPTPGEW